MSVRITLRSEAFSGGVGDAYDSADYADASAAVAAVSNNFLVVPNPVDSTGKAQAKTAYAVASIHSIVTHS